MLRSLFTTRRIWALLAGVTLVVGATRWLIAPDVGLRLVVWGGYWFMLAVAILFGRALLPVVRDRIRAGSFCRFDIVAGALVVVASVMWSAHEERGFKVLSDEVLLLGTSMGMHYERGAAYPLRMTDVQGPLQIVQRVLDKRPLLFPFLVSVLHDTTGYRPENAFYLNALLGALFLWLVYLIGWNISGERWAGIFGVGLFAGLPLLGQQSVGGGFDLLNLTLIATWGWLMFCYFERPDASRLEALVLGALMLASTRYESVLFLLPTALAVILGWSRTGAVNVSVMTLATPLFLLPILLHNRIFAHDPEAWQTASMPGVGDPFGVQYFAPNLGHALAFFFDLSGNVPNSPLFAAIGLPATCVLLVWMFGVLRTPLRSEPALLASAILALGLFMVTALYLLYFWGQFDHPVIRRLSLPVHLLMLVAILIVGRLAFRARRGWQWLSCAAGVAVALHGIPTMAKQAYLKTHAPAVEMMLRREFVRAAAERNFLFIDNDSVFWLTHRVPAMTVPAAVHRKPIVAHHLLNHTYDAIYVFQSVLVDERTGMRSIDPADDLGSDFELTAVSERRIGEFLFARISRVISVGESGRIIGRATNAVEVDTKRWSRAEIEAARTTYLEEWIRKLP